MAIEPIRKVTIINAEKASRRLMKTVSRLGMIDVTDVGERLAGDEGRLRPLEVSTEETDERLYKIDFILNLLNTHVPEEKGFFEGVAPVPQVVDQAEVKQAIEGYDLDGVFRRAGDLDETLRRSERTRGEIEQQLLDLEPLAGVPFTMKDFHAPRRVALFYGTIPAGRLQTIDASAEPWVRAAWERVEPRASAEGTAAPTDGGPNRQQDRATMIAACPAEDGEDLRKALSGLGFEEVRLPVLPGTVEDHILELRGDLAEVGARIVEAKEGVREMAGDRRTLVTLKAFWLARRNEHVAATRTRAGRWVHVLTGYIRAKDVEGFREAMKKEVPEAVILLEEPGPDEDVPVSLSLPRGFQPLSILVEMFGLPGYRSFDPTPFLHFNFYIFFGICFSDVGYGVMLLAMSYYLSRKTRDYEGVNNFARVLLYGGVSTVMFGALLGSWFGDLYQAKYLGEGNILLRLQSFFAVLDPIEKTIHALLLALAIGVLNQFYGIALKMYGALRRGDWRGAVFDGLFWLILLPGVLIMASKLFVPTPPRVFNLGLGLFVAGGLGLVATQGRDLGNPVSRILGGLVSLYGIIGSYGITAFIGDTLSYCRLLALGLTTSIVGMTFNMIGGLLRDIPYVGFFIFVFIVVAGHVFNFAISLLGAFVHSMRLIFVEFFGRFYEVGARPFQPLGFDSPLCIIRKTRDGR